MVNKHRLYWTLQIGGWLSYAAVQIVSGTVAFGGLSPRRIIFLIVEAIICLLVTHSFRAFLNKHKWLHLGMARLIPQLLVSVIVLGLAVYFLRMPVSWILGLFDSRVAFDPNRIISFSFIYILMIFIWSVLYFTYHYFDRYSKSLQYEASMIEIELSNLKSQLNPHFIFNALNSIRALVDENPGKAKQAINQLSNILRTSLASDKMGLTKFDDEMKIVKDYLGLESIRFEERLKTELSIDPDSNNFLVPPLMLQTLVENGIKHGISKLTAGGLVQVRTQVEGNKLVIQIRNSGHMVNGAKRNKRGLGLKNTMQRLKLIYGDEASFRIANENDTFVLTEIIIPKNTYESINRG
jgi:two-component system LytT family sensor kinase